MAGRSVERRLRGPRLIAAGLVVAAVIAGAGACGGGPWNQGRGVADSCAGVSGTEATPGVSRDAAPTKLLVFVVENRSRDQMCGLLRATLDRDAQPGLAMNYRAASHPSLPNYLAIVAGDTFGVDDDGPPSENRLPGRTIFGRALSAGKTAKVYAEGMPANCSPVDGGERYAVRHNPWTYFAVERRACSRYDVPMSELETDTVLGRLPNAGLVVPDLCHDGHDCSLATVDHWLAGQLDLVVSGPDWRAGRLAVVVTADEDDGSQDNRILTALMHPNLAVQSVETPLTHYSLSRLYAEVLGVRPLREAATAPSMAEAFHLRLAP